MADVKIHKCFPTTIYQFEYHPLVDDYANMEMHVSETRKNYRYHTDDDLHKQLQFIKLREKIYEVSKQYFNNLEYEYDKLEITGMWANKLYQGDAHPPHTHSNNILSGVYYLKSDKKSSPIQFFDPRAQATVLRPRNKPNWDNATMVQFNSTQGTGYVFPSWLMHWVPPTQDERISVSWNIIVRGNYGEDNTLQNAYI